MDKIRKTKLNFKGHKKLEKPEKTPNFSRKEPKADSEESNRWFDCKSVEEVYGPSIIHQNGKCIAFDEIQGFHLQTIEESPSNVSQVFVFRKFFSFVGITNSQGFYLNSDLDFISAALGPAEQFFIKVESEKFLIKSCKNEYISIEDNKIRKSKEIFEGSHFSIRCQTAIVEASQKQRKRADFESSLGLPKKKAKRD
eukprot:NODE_270_length_11220_cov_0.981387.p6 type:complete len:197 gc:universal NODE_270_length_11220_cov_0.981387:7586-6996(-)